MSNLQSVQSQLTKMGATKQNNKGGGRLFTFYEAIDFIKGKMVDDKKNQDNSEKQEKKKNKLTKEDLRANLRVASQEITAIVTSNGIQVRDYSMKDFIEEAAEEFAGYSILADAFYDPRINNIYLLDENTIFVDVNGVDMLYHKSFRNREHYESVIKRFVQLDQKELNHGDSKIVNFEFYQDRGCVISSSISPRGMSLTIRKHKEDHITREQNV